MDWKRIGWGGADGVTRIRPTHFFTLSCASPSERRIKMSIGGTHSRRDFFRRAFFLQAFSGWCSSARGSGAPGARTAEPLPLSAGLA